MADPTIDASAAIEKLGITRPVKFESTDLNPDKDLALSALFGDGIVSGAVNPQEPNTVRVDWPAIRVSAQLGMETPESVIAHELLHVKQLQDDPDAVKAAQRRVSSYGAYRANAYEAEAFARSHEFAPFVHIEGLNA